MMPSSKVLWILGRDRHLFVRDLHRHEEELSAKVRGSAFLVLGGAGTIGRAVTRELFRRGPSRLHVVDLSENNLVEVVRDLRSSIGYIDGELRALPLDCGSLEFLTYLRSQRPFDYVLNLTALKHVRSEKDRFSLMRMVQTNILNTVSTLELAADTGVGGYFAVSTDKAARPANAMGATKRAMELALVSAGDRIRVSSARFANVAFSDGSLLDGFNRRLTRRQPLSAPEDVRRYFITESEAGLLCLFACLLGGNREAFYPDPAQQLEPTSFRTLAERTLAAHGLRAVACNDEDEARARVEELAAVQAWPCYFFRSDTTGEKELEEFTMDGEVVDRERFEEMSAICWPDLERPEELEMFLDVIRGLRAKGEWSRAQIIAALRALVPEFQHRETGKFLDDRM